MKLVKWYQCLFVLILSSFTLPAAWAEVIVQDLHNKVPVFKDPISQPQIHSPRLWNLQDADIISVINEVSQETGKNFIVDPRVNGKISLISSKPLRQKEVYQVFLSVLSILGYAAIDSGDVVKIVPNMESGEQATEVANRYAPGIGEEVVVRVIPLANVSATQLIPILRPLLPQWSNISAYSPGNVLILLGRANNLQRLVKVIHDVDRASSSHIEIIQLKHASAAQIAVVINNLQNAARSTGETQNISIAVDERTNSILLGGPKAMRLRIRVLIAQLDSPAATASGNTEVIYLRYLQAKTLAPVLSKIAQNIIGKDSGTRYDASSTINAGGTSVTASAKSVAVDGIIQPEVNVNAIIITAPPALMQALKAVIAKLDIRPAQVLVEAIIADVDESHLRNLGIQWGSRGLINQTINGDVALTNNTPGSNIDFPQLGAGVIGLIPGGPNIRAVLSALENQNGVNILSTPQIMVLDNQKATIEVGQDVPEQTGSYQTSATGAGNPFNTVGRKKVTLKLEVTPQINLGCSVRMKIDLKNDTLQNPDQPGLNPLINTSHISNTVIINSDSILVLGGLITNSTNENTNKVPFFGDIPGLGLLFKQKAAKLQKKKLMVFIKPIIVPNHELGMLITHDKYNNTRRTEANFKEDLLDIAKVPPENILPPWRNRKDLPTPFENKALCPNGVCIND